MKTQPGGQALSYLKNYVTIASFLVMGMGVAVFLGWMFDIESLKSIVPGLATMKANTALCFIFLGIALWLNRHERPGDRKINFIGWVFAGIVVVISLVTLIEYVTGLDLGIDQFFFQDVSTTAQIYPGRMSLTTALDFLLLGIALLFLDFKIRGQYFPSQWLALLAGAVAAIALIGYLYGVESLYSVGIYSSMAFHTAFSFALLSAGILFARPQHGFMKTAFAETIGGVVLRRLIPLAAIILLVIGWLRLRGQQLGWYDTHFGLALMIILSITSLSVLLWLNAGRLNDVDIERKRAEKQFQYVVESAPDAILLVDQRGIIVMANAQAEKYFGYNRIELLGSNVERLVPKNFRKNHPHYRDGFLATPEPRLMGAGRDLYGLRKDESEFPVEIGLTPLDMENGLLVMVNILDITERKHAEEQNRFLASLVANISDAIIAVDLEQNIQSWNIGAETLYGWPEKEVLGRPARDFLDTDFLTTTRENVNKQIIEQGYWKGEVSQRRRDGTRIPVLSSISLYKDSQGKAAGIVAVNRDITEQKLAEEKIYKLNMELEQRVVERTAQLEAVNKELEAFSYSVSHDLRAPLRSIDGFSDALLEDDGDRLSEQGRGYLTRVRRSAQRMAGLIDDMLALSRVTRATLKSETIDLSALASEIAAELKNSNPERNVTFVIASDLIAKGDLNLLRVMLENLLNNAFKFTSKREQSEIEFGVKDENGEKIYFIRDNGAGFDMEYADKLFGAFQRLHGMDEFEGTGIGLATVQRIIRRHGGRVWGEGVVGKGAVFYFTL